MPSFRHILSFCFENSILLIQNISICSPSKARGYSLQTAIIEQLTHDQRLIYLFRMPEKNISIPQPI
jgi:hypothetical protein